MPSSGVAALLAGAERFVSTSVVTARRLDETLTWRTVHGDELRARPGDWELTDADGDRWTVAPETFARTYRRLPDGRRFVKHEEVEAVRVRESVCVPTHEGPVVARPGDWLLRDAAGVMWPVPNVRFRARYRPASVADTGASDSPSRSM